MLKHPPAVMKVLIDMGRNVCEAVEVTHFAVCGIYSFGYGITDDGQGMLVKVRTVHRGASNGNDSYEEEGRVHIKRPNRTSQTSLEDRVITAVSQFFDADDLPTEVEGYVVNELIKLIDAHPPVTLTVILADPNEKKVASEEPGSKGGLFLIRKERVLLAKKFYGHEEFADQLEDSKGVPTKLKALDSAMDAASIPRSRSQLTGLLVEYVDELRCLNWPEAGPEYPLGKDGVYGEMESEFPPGYAMTVNERALVAKKFFCRDQFLDSLVSWVEGNETKEDFLHEMAAQMDLAEIPRSVSLLTGDMEKYVATLRIAERKSPDYDPKLTRMERVAICNKFFPSHLHTEQAYIEANAMKIDDALQANNIPELVHNLTEGAHLFLIEMRQNSRVSDETVLSRKERAMLGEQFYGVTDVPLNYGDRGSGEELVSAMDEILDRAGVKRSFYDLTTDQMEAVMEMRGDNQHASESKETGLAKDYEFDEGEDDDEDILSVKDRVAIMWLNKSDKEIAEEEASFARKSITGIARVRSILKQCRIPMYFGGLEGEQHEILAYVRDAMENATSNEGDAVVDIDEDYAFIARMVRQFKASRDEVKDMDGFDLTTDERIAIWCSYIGVNYFNVRAKSLSRTEKDLARIERLLNVCNIPVQYDQMDAKQRAVVVAHRSKSKLPSLNRNGETSTSWPAGEEQELNVLDRLERVMLYREYYKLTEGEKSLSKAKDIGLDSMMNDISEIEDCWTQEKAIDKVLSRRGVPKFLSELYEGRKAFIINYRRVQECELERRLNFRERINLLRMSNEEQAKKLDFDVLHTEKQYDVAKTLDNLHIPKHAGQITRVQNDYINKMGRKDK